MKEKNNNCTPSADEELLRNLQDAEKQADMEEKAEKEFAFVADTPAEPEEKEPAPAEANPVIQEENGAETPPEEPAPDTSAQAPAAKQTDKKKEPGILGICLPLIIIRIGVALMLAASFLAWDLSTIVMIVAAGVIGLSLFALQQKGGKGT